MAFVPSRYALDPDPSVRRRRAIALLLTVLVHALLLVLLIRIGPSLPLRKVIDSLPVTFDLAPKPEAETVEKRSKDSAGKITPKPPAPPVSVTPAKTPPVADTPLPFIVMSKNDMAAADITGMRRSGGAQDAGGGSDSRAVSGPGQGPGGAQLYEADWYRKPTNAELSTYLPSDAPRVGWGLVACKTVENYHVENCQTIGESPLGSGFARAVRQAAWQFLVKPPRIGGKAQIGAWVRIRIDYVQGVAQ